MGTNETTVTSAVAGSAFGVAVGWGLSAATGVDTTPVVASFSILGAFTFGRIFGPK